MNKKRIFPFGYRMTEGQIDLNAEEAEVIRFIFQKYSEGFPKENQERAGEILQQICFIRKVGLRGMRFHVPTNHLG